MWYKYGCSERNGRNHKRNCRINKRCKGFGCAKLVVFCNAVEDNPFMAGAFHGVGEADRIINVGVSGPGVVKRALEKVKGEPFDVVSETVKRLHLKLQELDNLWRRKLLADWTFHLG